MQLGGQQLSRLTTVRFATHRIRPPASPRDEAMSARGCFAEIAFLVTFGRADLRTGGPSST